jgi:hypothetical protein
MKRPGNPERLICLEDDGPVHRNNIGVTVHVTGFGQTRRHQAPEIRSSLEISRKGNADETHSEIVDRPDAWRGGYFTDPWREPGKRLPLYVAGQGQGLQVLNWRDSK